MTDAGERDLPPGTEGFPELLRPGAPAPSQGEALVRELTAPKSARGPLSPGVLEPPPGEAVVTELTTPERPPEPLSPGVIPPAAGEHLVNELAAAPSAPLTVRLHWREAGEGDDVVLFVHGFPLSGAIWDDQLAGVPPGWRYFAPDLPGFGRTPPLPAVSMDIFARELELFLEERGIRRVVVCGLSMGGYVAFALRRLAPDRIRALVLADTRAGPDDEEGRRARYENAARARAEGPTGVTEAMLPKLLSSRTLRERPEVVERLRAIMAEATAAGVAAALEGMAERPDSTPDLGIIDVPTLVVVGRQDAITPPEEAERMAAVLHRPRLTVIPGAGHLTCMECPADFNRALRQFLQDLR